MVNVAICYFGMPRSLRKVFDSHEDKLFQSLKKKNIHYKIFVHSWITDSNIVWNKDCKVPNDYKAFDLLNPHDCQLDNQDDFLQSITFSDYFDKKIFDEHGGDTHHEWHPELIRNQLCALESQKRVTNKVIETNEKFDYVIYIRPDVKINTEFSIDFLEMAPTEIAIPNDDHNEGYNDRFAIVAFNSCSFYGKRIDEIKEFRKNHGRIVSEKFVKHILLKYFTRIIFIPFKFSIVRP